MKDLQSSALLGHTGFVGSSLARQHDFADCYNSKNIDAIKGRKFDLVVCAAAPGVKWLANQQPAEDLAGIQRLESALEEVKTGHFVLISTVDVLDQPINSFEDSEIKVDALSAYGKHRYQLEQFVKDHFSDHTIIRLPGLFGQGLKKNLIFDIINRQRYDTFNADSAFQFYNMDRLWSDIETVMAAGESLIHMAVEPVSVYEVAETVGEGHLFTNHDAPRVTYDFKTRYSNLFSQQSDYMESKARYLPEIGQFISSQREQLV